MGRVENWSSGVGLVRQLAALGDYSCLRHVAGAGIAMARLYIDNIFPHIPHKATREASTSQF